MPIAGGFAESAPPEPASPPPASPALAQSPSVSAIFEQQGKQDTIEPRATDLRRQVSDLHGLVGQVRQLLEQRRAQKPPSTDPGEQQAASNAPEQQQAADLQQQDIELHRELQGLIAQLEQELELETQSPLSSDPTEQQERRVARDAFKRVLSSLQQQASELDELIGEHPQEPARDPQRAPAAANLGEPPTERDLFERQTADMRKQNSDLQRQNDALRRQLAERQQELAQRAEELAQRTHDVEAARAEAEKLWEVLETLNHQPRGEQAAPALQNAEGQQMAVAAPPSPVAPRSAPRPKRPTPVRHPSQPPPTPQLPVQPTQPVSPPFATQQLQSARQWLAMEQPQEARRLLVTVQTQMVFAPVTPDQPAAVGRNPSAKDVGDAIRWLDLSAIGEAMRSITRAIESSAKAGG
jgi:hypothetical protein